ncbi:MAG: PIN domain-containing protein [Pseudomonadota bacterium]
MRLALDSNILIYAEGGNDTRRQKIAHDTIAGLLPSQILIPLQAAAETFQWLVKKGGVARAEASARTSWWLESFTTQDTSREVFSGALELANVHGLQFFDALILAAAAAANVDILLSEDMHEGFAWRGVTVTNPFAAEPSPMIQKILSRD